MLGHRRGTAATLAGAAFVLSMLFGVASAGASLRVLVNPIAYSVRVTETSPARDVLRVTWERKNRISRFTDPAGLRLEVVGGDKNPSYGGYDGCEQLRPTVVACGYLPYVFSTTWKGGAKNAFKLGRGNDVLRADRDLPYSDNASLHRVGISVSGGRGRDRVKATDFHDFLVGGRGNDSLYGLGDVDTLFGCSGNDLLRGGSSSGPFARDPSQPRKTNRVVGGPGRDRIAGKSGGGRGHRDGGSRCAKI